MLKFENVVLKYNVIRYLLYPCKALPLAQIDLLVVNLVINLVTDSVVNFKI